MAILKGILRKMNGSAGDLTFKTVNGQTVVSEKVTSVKNARTAAQQKHRMPWANIVRMYKGIAPLLNYGFESKPAGMTDYNMFVRVNTQLQPVYLPKDYVAGGACIVAPYQITQGSLSSIAVSGEGADRTTDIALGKLTLSDTTTVADLSNAVVENNANFRYGDQISFFSVLQRVNAATKIPYGVFRASSVVLDKTDNTLLWSATGKPGFQVQDGFLAHGEDEGDGAFCWVHSRKSAGKTLVSSQQLLDHNSLLAEYTSQDAYDAAVATYGGESDVFLAPDGTKNAAAGSSLSGPSSDDPSGSDEDDEEAGSGE